MSYQRPGIYTEERLNPTSVSVAAAPASTGALLASHARGPITPTRIRSWSEFLKTYGSFSDGDLAHAAFSFFANGGTDLYCLRVAGTGATAATRTLNDMAGTPLPTLDVTAKSPGAWGNTLYVEVADGGAAGYFDLIIYEGGSTQEFIVERWSDLTMDDADDRFVESVVNHQTKGSSYVTVTDLDSPTVAPNDQPAAAAATVLASGADGTAADTSALTAAVNSLDTVPGPFNLNVPGVSTPGVLSAAINYAEARGDIFVICDPAVGDTPADAVTAAGTLTESSYGAMYYPRVWIADPSSSDPNALRLAPPGPSVMGLMAAVDRESGPWQAPAGINKPIVGAVSLETTLTNADLGTLNAGHVNALRNIGGVGIRVWGTRTLKLRQADRYIPVRRTLNFIKSSLTNGTEFAVFEPNDERLWSQLRSTCYSFLASIHQSGGLRGASADDAFYVKCDETLNTQAVIDSGQVIVEVGVALLQPSEFIVIRIGQWQGGNSSSSTEG